MAFKSRAFRSMLVISACWLLAVLALTWWEYSTFDPAEWPREGSGVGAVSGPPVLDLLILAVAPGLLVGVWWLVARSGRRPSR